VLPTVSMQIPAGQYLSAMRQLAVTFTTWPVLSDQFGLHVPLPEEAGFTWSWVNRGAARRSPRRPPRCAELRIQSAAVARGLARLDPQPCSPL